MKLQACGLWRKK